MDQAWSKACSLPPRLAGGFVWWRGIAAIAGCMDFDVNQEYEAVMSACKMTP